MKNYIGKVINGKGNTNYFPTAYVFGKTLLVQKTKNIHLLFESIGTNLKTLGEIIAVFNTSGLVGVVHRTLKF
jgi:hypothetical protein